MSIDINTKNQIVFKSSGTGANSYALNLVCPSSVDSVDKNIYLVDTPSDNYIRYNIKSTVLVPVATALAPGPVLLTNAQSCSTFLIPAQTQAFTIQLPVPLAGLEYEFVMLGTAGANVLIQASGAGLMAGNLLRSAGPAAASALVSITGATQSIRFNATAVIGDRMRVICDGTRWYASGQSSAAAGISFV